MRHGVIAVAVISVLLGSTAQSSYGDTAYGVGSFMGIKAISGIWSLDTDAAIAKMLVYTPGVSWSGATDGPSADKFYAVANPSYAPDIGSELFLINTTDWTVNSLGFVRAPSGGGPIREIGLDESTSPGTLYGTDYANLYTVPTAGGPDPTATFVGTFGTHPGTSNLIDYVFSMDYDPSVGQLVGTSWRRNDDQTDLYYFDRTTGAGTLVGDTGIDFLSDVWHSNNSGKLLGVSQAPGQILDVDATTGEATNSRTVPDVNFYGMANATPGSPEPFPYVTAPLTDRGYETYAYADIATVVDIPGVGNHSPTDDRDDYGTNGAANVTPFDVLASVQDPQSGFEPWHNTTGSAAIDNLGRQWHPRWHAASLFDHDRRGHWFR